MGNIQQALIFSNRSKQGAGDVASEIGAYLRECGIAPEAQLYDPHAPSIDLNDIERVSFAICIGGDGTALYLCRALVGYQIPILTINYGQLGFITEFSLDNWKDEIDRMRAGTYEIEERILIDVEVLQDGAAHAKMCALNDAVISVTGISRLMHYTVSIADQFLAEYRADGLIVATPTGSTAYSVAAGGPILHPTLPALIVNPICPFTLAHRPIVIPITEEINVVPHYIPATDTVLTVDGQETLPLDEGQRVKISASEKKALIVKSHRYSFYKAIRQKLKWSGATHVE